MEGLASQNQGLGKTYSRSVKNLEHISELWQPHQNQVSSG